VVEGGALAAVATRTGLDEGQKQVIEVFEAANFFPLTRDELREQLSDRFGVSKHKADGIRQSMIARGMLRSARDAKGGKWRLTLLESLRVADTPPEDGDDPWYDA
jgi:hypothetical protein